MNLNRFLIELKTLVARAPDPRQSFSATREFILKGRLAERPPPSYLLAGARYLEMDARGVVINVWVLEANGWTCVEASKCPHCGGSLLPEAEGQSVPSHDRDGAP